MKHLIKTMAAIGAGTAIGLGAMGAALAATPKSGGVLNFVVPSNPPSYDAHQETTFGVIHPLSPAYSLLIRVDPENPQSSEFVCDLCVGQVPAATNGGKTNTF
jgi:peptide/nickel transport system substrate-binding protein